MVNVVTWSLYRGGNGPWYPLDWRLCGSQNHSEPCGEKEGTLPLSGMEHRIHDRPAGILATALTAVPATSIDLALGNNRVHLWYITNIL